MIVKGIALLSPQPKILLLKPSGYPGGFKFIIVSSKIVKYSIKTVRQQWLQMAVPRRGDILRLSSSRFVVLTFIIPF